jgi:hypothetical protein
MKSILQDFLFGFEMFEYSIIRHQELLTGTSKYLDPVPIFWLSINYGWIMRKPISSNAITFYSIIRGIIRGVL